MIDGALMLCGGNSITEGRTCYSYLASTDVWLEASSLTHLAQYSASVMTPQGWWITGKRQLAETRYNRIKGYC